MKRLFVAIPICGFGIFMIFFGIGFFTLSTSEEVDECAYASISDLNRCLIERYAAPLQLNVCKHVGSISGCPIIIPETEQECLDLYEIYKLAFEAYDHVKQIPAYYGDYKERRCDI